MADNNNELKEAWLAREKESFSNITMFIIARLETAILKSIAKTLKDKLADGEKAEVAVPWGTYRATIVQVGETGNINVSYEPSKDFLEILNTKEGKAGHCEQDVFDEKLRKYFHTYTAYGCFDVNDPKNKEIVQNKDAHCLDMSPVDEEYFLCEYGTTIARVAKDKQRPDKVYRLQLGESCKESTDGAFDFGALEFEYNDDDSIVVKFIASPTFKQALKNDSVANLM